MQGNGKAYDPVKQGVKANPQRDEEPLKVPVPKQPFQSTVSNPPDKPDEGPLYTAMIIALCIGIVIVIVTLIVMRPEPEYFTELYYTNHTLLPKYISQNESYSYGVVIHNLENGTIGYQVETKLTLYKGEKMFFESRRNESVTVAKGDTAEREYAFIAERDFTKARVMTSLIGKEQEIHFWTYNEAYMAAYPDFVATVSCLKKGVNITTSESVTVATRGRFGPRMRVLFNGQELFAGMVEATNYTDYVIPANISTGYLDIIFDNDFYNATTKEDRNLYIKEVRIGNKTLTPAQGIVDTGIGAKAFDCDALKEITEGISWNGALRFRLEAS